MDGRPLLTDIGLNPKPRIFPICSDSVHPRYMWSIRPKHHVPLTSLWNTGFIFIIISGAENKL